MTGVPDLIAALAPVLALLEEHSVDYLIGGTVASCTTEITGAVCPTLD